MNALSIILIMLAATGMAQTGVDCNDSGLAQCAKLVYPMEFVKDDNGESYFHVKDDGKIHPHSTQAYYYYECSEDTDLTVSLKTTTPGTNSNSLYISMDSSWYRVTWHMPWKWTPTWQTFNLKTFKVKQGLHELHIWNREDGTRVHEARLEGDICHFVEEPRETEPPATGETTEATTEPTDATEEPTEATQEPTDATMEPTEATQEPTDATMEPTEVTIEPTEATMEPTEGTAEPTEATVEPTEGTAEPTEATVEPTTASPTTADPTEATQEPSAAPTAPVWCPSSTRYLNHRGTNLKTISGLESVEACEEACDAYVGTPRCNFIWFFHPVGTRKSRCKMVGDAHKLKPWNPTDTRAITFAGRLCGVNDMTVSCRRDVQCWTTDTCDLTTETCVPGLYPDQLKDTLEDATFLVETSEFSTDDMFVLLQLLFAMVGLFVVAHALLKTAKGLLFTKSYTRVPGDNPMAEEEL